MGRRSEAPRRRRPTHKEALLEACARFADERAKACERSAREMLAAGAKMFGTETLAQNAAARERAAAQEARLIAEHIRKMKRERVSARL